MFIIIDDAANKDINDVVAHTATMMGFSHVYHIPDREDLTTEESLWHIPKQSKAQNAIWIGYIPYQERYSSIYQILVDKNIFLVNTPEQHKLAMNFDLFYPIIAKYTPNSKVLLSVDECENAAIELGFPIFVKGAIKSAKEQGIKACKATNFEELVLLVNQTLKQAYKSRNKAILRQYVPLKHSSLTPGQFPMGREYRYLLYNNEIITSGYYWESPDSLAALTIDEKQNIDSLAIEISGLLQVPLIAIDIGQLENDEWIVIEVGDPQCCGISKSMSFEFWNKIVSK